MRKKLWFRRKRYGWGWTPATKEGWAITLLYIAFVVLVGVYADKANSLRQSIELFFFPIIIATVALIAICYKKGEHPQWGWGDDERE